MKLPGDCPFIVRLDGVSFKRYTSKLEKPFDPNFTRALQLTTIDLMNRSTAITGFCQSDEITLISGPATNNDCKNHLYSGRTQKISSVLASLAAVRFNYHMQQFGHDSGNEPALFDARVFSVPDWESAAEVLVWRHSYDCRRNALHSIAQAHYPRTQLEGEPIKSVLAKLLEEKGVDATLHYPTESVFGSFVKKRLHSVLGFNPKTNESIPTARARFECQSFDLSEKPVEFLVDFVKNPLFE